MRRPVAEELAPVGHRGRAAFYELGLTSVTAGPAARPAGGTRSACRRRRRPSSSTRRRRAAAHLAQLGGPSPPCATRPARGRSVRTGAPSAPLDGSSRSSGMSAASSRGAELDGGVLGQPAGRRGQRPGVQRAGACGGGSHPGAAPRARPRARRRRPRRASTRSTPSSSAISPGRPDSPTPRTGCSWSAATGRWRTAGTPATAPGARVGVFAGSGHEPVRPPAAVRHRLAVRPGRPGLRDADGHRAGSRTSWPPGSPTGSGSPARRSACRPPAPLRWSRSTSRPRRC